MTQPELGPVLRGINQARDTVREAGNLLRQGHHPGERLERALTLLVKLSEAMARVVEGAPAAPAAPVPLTVIGPVAPEGGESRRLHLLEHPEDRPVDEEQVAAAADSFKSAVEAEVHRIMAGLMTPRTAVSIATPGQVVDYLGREAELAAAGEPAAFVQPVPIPADDLDAMLGDDDLDAVGRGHAVAPLPPGWTPPPGAGPEYVPPGSIPRTPSIVANSATTFIPFGDAQLTHDQAVALEQAVAADQGRRAAPIPVTVPGLAEDDPDAWESAVERARILDQAAQRSAPAPGLGSPAQLDDAVPAPEPAPRPDPTARPKVPPCPDCGKQCSALVGLSGHAAAKHGFSGTHEQLLEWARAGGSASSAA